MKKEMTKGYVTLLSMLVTTAIAGSITISLLLLGLSQSQTTFSMQESGQAGGLSHACAEEALDHIQTSPAYTGTTTLNPAGEGSCTYNVANTGGSTRRINAEGAVDTVSRKTQVVLSDTSPMTITSWLEVGDF